MTTVTYDTALRCTISPGLRDDEVTATIFPDARGSQHCIRVPRDWIEHDADGTPYLPVLVVEFLWHKCEALVQFPAESDAGYRRAYVGFDVFRVVDGEAV